MKCWTIKPYIAILALAILLAACATPRDDSASSSNTNAAEQANSNSQEPVAQSEAPIAVPNPSPPRVQQLPPPEPKRAEKPAALANAANGSARGPKLVVPEQKLNFGKQPQDKTMVRAIPVRNGGQSILNIESVTPS